MQKLLQMTGLAKDKKRSKTPKLKLKKQTDNAGDEEVLSVLGEQSQYHIILPKLGGGSFGEIFLAVESDGSRNLIVKREKKREKKRVHLINEYDVMTYLKSCPNIPHVYWHQSKGNFHYMVMEMVGPNLMELWQICGKSLDLYTLIDIMKQMITTFKYIHSYGIIHRDLKPENITVGSWPYNCSKVYLIDFGLSKQIFEDENGTKKHIKEKNPARVPRGSITGTVRYASINAHYGDQSRRDDLLSFGHIMVYFICQKLPWMGVKSYTKKEKYLKICKKKEQYIDFYEIKEPYCSLLPKCVKKYMKLCNAIEFDEKPSYSALIRMFNRTLKRHDLIDPRNLAWNKPQFTKQQWPPEYELAPLKNIVNLNQTKRPNAMVISNAVAPATNL